MEVYESEHLLFEKEHTIYKFFIDEANNSIFAVSNDKDGEKAIVRFHY